MRFSINSVRTRWGICREPDPCLGPGHVFWPQDETCYPQHRRGPCPKGELLTATAGSGEIGECKCKSTGALGQYYWAPGDSCHEYFTRGPCVEQGTLFLPNGQCGCNKDLPHYNADTGLCYEIGKTMVLFFASSQTLHFSHATAWTIKASWGSTFVFVTASIMVLEPTQPPIKMSTAGFYTRNKWLGHNAAGSERL